MGERGPQSHVTTSTVSGDSTRTPTMERAEKQGDDVVSTSHGVTCGLEVSENKAILHT